MDKVQHVDFGLDRPLEAALIDAIQNAIAEVGDDKLTPAEILGCLETVKMQFWVDVFLY